MYLIMDFFQRTGKLALGSRLRMLTAQLTDDSAQIYELYGLAFSPKWFPVLFVLYHQGGQSITEIAGEIGHSQPSVTKIIKEMGKAGLVRDNVPTKDRRTKVVELTPKGKETADTVLHVQGDDIVRAMDGIMAEATHNLWEAIAEWEYLLDQRKS